MAARSRKSGKSAPTFEERLEALETVVEALESGSLDLETSLQRYKEGAEHLQACRTLLDQAETRLAELVEDADGGLAERPLRVGEDRLEDDLDADGD